MTTRSLKALVVVELHSLSILKNRLPQPQPQHGWPKMEQQLDHISNINYKLERYLIDHQGYDDYDAWLRVSYDYETVKKEWKIYTELGQTAP